MLGRCPGCRQKALRPGSVTLMLCALGLSSHKTAPTGMSPQPEHVLQGFEPHSVEPQPTDAPSLLLSREAGFDPSVSGSECQLFTTVSSET